jgi:diaminopimelate epimerase
MRLKFTKMHGLGNDFVVIDTIRQPVTMSHELVQHLASRRRGIGCDQVLLVEAARSPETDFYYRIFNADGSEVGQCGNGARCFARFVYDYGLTEKKELVVETQSGLMTLQLQDQDQISVIMGVPCFTPAQIPFVAEKQANSYFLTLDNQTWELGVVSVGNPHAVLLCDDIAQAPVTTLGPQIERAALFPQRVNVNFMQVNDRHHIQLRVWERGVGETEACGSGACATVVVAQLWGLVATPVQVTLPGGDLLIQWPGGATPVTLTGTATVIFDGELTV